MGVILPDLPGHGEVWPHRLVHGERQQRGDDGAARGGPVLGGGALGHVQVHAVLHQELIIVSAQARSLGMEHLREGVGDTHALLHDVAQVARHLNSPLCRWGFTLLQFVQR